jgi:hypothetical protein
MQANRRIAERKAVRSLSVVNFTVVDPFQQIAKRAQLAEASSVGLKLLIQRKDLIPDQLRLNLTLDPILDKPVMMILEEMDLELAGRVVRSRMIGNGIWEIAIDFSQDAPEYWRECLVDLLPGDDEDWG